MRTDEMVRAADVAINAMQPAIRLQIAATLIAAEVRADYGMSDQVAYVDAQCVKALNYADRLLRLAAEGAR